ncbi:MAG: hypothetical protein M3Z31_11195, partial [Pseudomonadota bacterium]|nr:hypothetical protein [Pseudomonadota bacterium]
TLRDDGNPLTIELIYAATLLLHLGNAGNLSRTQIHWLATQLEGWCSRVRVSVTSPGPTAFFVDVTEAAGLRRRGASPLERKVLFVDTEPLHALLQHYVMAIEQKIRTEPLSPKTSRRVERLGLLTKIASQVDTQYRPVVRRGERTVAVGKVDAIVGMTAISRYLREETSSPMPELDTVTTYSATLDLAIFGHARNEHARRSELARRRLAAFATPGGPWDMKDVSMTGFRLMASTEAASTLTLGMLTALRMQGDLVWTLGVIRRMRRVNAERAEIGLQRLADTVAVVDLAARQVARTDAPEDREGDDADETPSTRERRFSGLFLVLRQSRLGSAVQSLIIPAAEYRARNRLSLIARGKSYPVHCGTLLEEHTDWVWLSLEPLPLKAGPAAAMATG